MDWDRFLTLIFVAGGLATALSPILTAFLQARGKKDESTVVKAKTSLDGYEKLTDQLQEQLEKAITSNEKLEERIATYTEKILEYESERQLIIKKVEAQDGRIDQLEKELTEKDNIYAEEIATKERMWSVKEKGYQEAINTLTDKIAGLETRMNVAANTAQEAAQMAKEAKIGTDELKKQTGELNAEAARKKDDKRQT